MNILHKTPKNDNGVEIVRHYLDDYFEDFDICAYEPVFSKEPSCPVVHMQVSLHDKKCTSEG